MMDGTCKLGRLVLLLTTLVLAGGLLALTPDVARAADPSYPAAGATYGKPAPNQLITDVKVITGGSADIQCPAGYAQRYPELNLGSGGGDYVYTCLQFSTNAAQGIGELYVRSSANSPCTSYGRNDQFVAGDLNSGVTNDIFNHTALYYCIHRPGTTGGSARIPHPPTLDSGGYNEYFPTPDPASGKLLHDVQFLGFDPDRLPSCVTTDCVDTSPIGAFAFLNAAKTIDPYCQRYYGPTYHPLLSPWEYESSSGDRGADVPQDAQVLNLNQASLGRTLLYACGSYIVADTTPPTLTASATTTDGQPYTPGTWTNQDVTVRFSCTDNAGGSGVASFSPPRTIVGGADLPAVSGTCADNAGNIAAPASFGPIRIDQIKPRIAASATTADGKPYSAGAWANQDVTVRFSCAEDDAAAYRSGIATNTVAGATLTGEGANQSVTNTGSCSDTAGNVAAPTIFEPVKIDKTKPVITASATTADGKPYTPGVWTNQDVTVAFACAESGTVQSGLATNALTSQTLRTDGANLSATNASPCVDNAGNAAAPATLSGIKIDKTAPKITIATPTGTTYLLNQAVPAGYTCADPLADGTTPGSGVAACAGSVANGHALDTATVGTKTFTVTARDAVGNTASQSVTYTVAYSVCVLYDQTQVHKAGSTVPIKLALCDANSARVSSASIVVTATGLKQVGTTASSTPIDAGNANPDGHFRDVGDSYLYNLQTTGLAAGTWQLAFTVTGDPTTHTVQFQVR